MPCLRSKPSMARSCWRQLGKSGDGKPPFGCMQCGIVRGQLSAGLCDGIPAAKTDSAGLGRATSKRCWPARRCGCAWPAIPAPNAARGASSWPTSSGRPSATPPCSRDINRPPNSRRRFRTSSSTATRWAIRRGSGWIGPRGWTCGCWTSPRSRGRWKCCGWWAVTRRTTPGTRSWRGPSPGC